MKIKSLLAMACVASMMSMPTIAEELDGTLQKIKETGVITLGVRESSIPFSFLDDDQKYQGYSIDICHHITDRIAKELGMDNLEIKRLPITSSTRIPLTVNGTIDITCGSDANTLERQKQVDFSYTTYVGHASFAAKKNDNYKNINDLKGKTVASTSGTTDVKLLANLNKEEGLNIKISPSSDHANGFMMMDTGRAAAFAMTDILVASLIANSKNPDEYSMVLIDALPVEPWGLMFRRNDPQFKALVDDVLGEMFESGEMQALYEKWFNSEVPVLGINLNIPMSERLQNAMKNPTDSGDPNDYK